MNCTVCNKPLEPPHQRLCPACQEEFRQVVLKQLGGEEQYKKLVSWPKEDKKEQKK
jgi:hypothetical protein